MPAKKTTTRKKAKKDLSVKRAIPMVKKTEEKKTQVRRFNTLIAAIVLIVLVFVSAAYMFKDQLIVAVVNGQPITRITLIKELEKQAGKTTLDSIITKTLVIQEGQNQSVQITEIQIDEEIKKINDNLSAQGQNLDDLLKMDGLTQVDFRQEIKLQKTVEEIVGREASVSAEEVQQFIEGNKSFLPADSTPEELEQTAMEQLKQQKISQKVQDWLAKLHDQAKINYWLQF